MRGGTLKRRLNWRPGFWPKRGENQRWFTHWSTAQAGDKLGISHMMVDGSGNGGLAPIDWNATWPAMILILRRRQPHHRLYLHPPQHAACFAWMKRRIQALDRLDPVLLFLRASERHASSITATHLSLYAVSIPRWPGLGAHRDRPPASSCRFFTPSRGQPASGARFTSSSIISPPQERRRAGLPHLESQVYLHYSTYSSWLNQVELWFSKLSASHRRGIFSSRETWPQTLRYIAL